MPSAVAGPELRPVYQGAAHCICLGKVRTPATVHEPRGVSRATVRPTATLRKILIQLAVICITFQEFPLDETFNALLDDGRVGQKAAGELLRDLCNDAVVVQHPPGLHDAHYSRLYLRSGT